MSDLVSIDRLLERSARDGITVFSFDVFDTALTRTCARPTDLFIILGNRLRERGVLSLPGERFARLRIQAESEARAHHPKLEPTLAEIALILARRLGLPEAMAATLAEAELQAEEHALVALAPLAHGMAAIRATGRRVVFVSDMYLPAAFIRGILLREGVADPADQVFVSNERGASKHSGHLFKTVLQELQVAPEQVLHVGDHRHSDFLMPRKLGLRAVHFSASHLGAIEKAHLPFSTALRGVPSALAAASRVARLRAAGASHDAHHTALTEIGAGLLGPTLAAFALWTLLRAQQRGIRRLYFVSRDGQVIREAAQAVQRRVPRLAGIDCRYLYGSRIAWHHSSLRALTPRHLRWLLDPQPVINATILAHRLGIDPSALRTALQSTAAEALLAKPQWDAADLARLREVLPTRQEQILAEGGATRRTALGRRYFEQEGLFDGTPWGVVELGWSGSMLTSLHDALGAPEHLQAFYLCQTREDPDLPRAVTIESFLMRPDGPQGAFGRNLRLAEMIEALTAADHPTVLGYREDGGRIGPVLKENTVPMWPPESLAALRGGVTAFVDALPADTWRDWEELLTDDAHASLVAIQLLSVLARFVTEPAPHLAEPFTRCSFSEDPADEHRRTFVQPLTLRTALARSPFSENELWREGSLVCSSGFLQALATGGLSRGLGFAVRRVLKR